MGRRAWQATVHGVAESDRTGRLTLSCLGEGALLGCECLGVVHLAEPRSLHPCRGQECAPSSSVGCEWEVVPALSVNEGPCIHQPVPS